MQRQGGGSDNMVVDRNKEEGVVAKGNRRAWGYWW